MIQLVVSCCVFNIFYILVMEAVASYEEERAVITSILTFLLTSVCVTSAPLSSPVPLLQELQIKMARARFPWRWLLFLIFSICIGVITYDVVNSKGFKSE